MAGEKSEYSPWSDYARALKKKCIEESTSGGCSDGCSEGCGGCSDDQECGCCPTGLVAVEDKDGNHIGCLTPLDANLYMANTYRCPDGYIRVTATVSGVTTFVGCLTPNEYAAYVAALPA